MDDHARAHGLMCKVVKHLESNVSEKNPFDETATVAAEELKTLPADQAKVVADWWAKHYMKAGHKRLGRLMVAISKGKPI